MDLVCNVKSRFARGHGTRRVRTACIFSLFLRFAVLTLKTTTKSVFGSAGGDAVSDGSLVVV